MSGFEFTPMGIIPLIAKDPEAESKGDAPFAPAVVRHDARAALATATAEPRPPLPRVTAANAANAPPARYRPLDVIKLAKARLREIERTLRHHDKLKAERDKLKRLLDAAGRAPLRELPKRTA